MDIFWKNIEKRKCHQSFELCLRLPVLASNETDFVLEGHLMARIGSPNYNLESVDGIPQLLMINHRKFGPMLVQKMFPERVWTRILLLPSRTIGHLTSAESCC